MSYLEYYGLTHEPFTNAPVSRFFYRGKQHAEALVRLQHAVSNMRGLALCVGDIGRGKTTLARRLLESLPKEEYEAALLVIIHSGVTASWLLKRIATQLGVAYPAEDKLDLLSQLYKRLVEIHEEGRKAVVLIDEAQMLETRELMEEFRGLLNLEVPGQKLLSFVFFGLPELERCLALDPPLAQRVALKVSLVPLDEASTSSYIKHRLKLSGARALPYSREAMEAIHRYSGGTPRVLNTLCDNALFEGYVARKKLIDRATVAAVAEGLGLSPSSPAAPEQPLTRDAAVAQRRAGLVPEASEGPKRVQLSEVDALLDALKAG